MFRWIWACRGYYQSTASKKYGYQTGETHGKSAKQWADDSIHHEGSWWTYWHTWVQPMLGKRIKSKQTDLDIIIESAPGRYALQKAPLI